MRRIVPMVMLFACVQPRAERQDPREDHTPPSTVDIAFTVDGERILQAEDVAAIENLNEIRPTAAESCSQTFEWMVRMGDRPDVEAYLPSPQPWEAGLVFPLGTAFIESDARMDGAPVKQRLTGGMVEVLVWQPGQRRVQITGAQLCVGTTEANLMCEASRTARFEVETQPDDPHLPMETCGMTAEPWPDWPGDGPGPCVYGEHPCPE